MAKTAKQFYSELGCNGLSRRKSSGYTRSELSYLTKLIKPDQSILDLACGYGRFTVPLARKGYKIEGIDVTPALIECARRNAKRKGVIVSFKTGDMCDLPYDENTFDVVICMWSAFSEIVPQQDQIKVLSEMRRVLTPSGFSFIELRNHREHGLDKNYTIEGIPMMPTYKHSMKSLRELADLSEIKNYSVFTDYFGGRNRLFLQFWKNGTETV